VKLRDVPGLDAGDLQTLSTELAAISPDARVKQSGRVIELEPPKGRLFFSADQIADFEMMMTLSAERSDVTETRVRAVLFTSAQMAANSTAFELDEAAGIFPGDIGLKRKAAQAANRSRARGAQPKGRLQQDALRIITTLGAGGTRVEVAAVVEEAMRTFVPDSTDEKASRKQVHNRKAKFREAISGLANARLVCLFDGGATVSLFAGNEEAAGAFDVAA
jgi:hypothetical protein